MFNGMIHGIYKIKAKYFTRGCITVHGPWGPREQGMNNSMVTKLLQGYVLLPILQESHSPTSQTK